MHRSLASFGRAVAALVALSLLVGSEPLLAHDGLREQIVLVTAQLAQDPENPQLLLRRAELYRAIRQWKASLADLDRIAAIDSAMPAAALVRARVLLDSGQPAASAAVASQLLDRDTAHVEALLVRARAYAALGRDRAAIIDFTRAVEHQPSPDVYIERARLAAGSKAAGPAEALAGLDHAVVRLGPLVTLELEAIDLEIRLGRFDAGLARLDRLSRQAARQESWLARRGAILERAGRVDQALAAYQAALHAVTTAPQARRSRAATALLASLQASILRLEKKPASPTTSQD